MFNIFFKKKKLTNAEWWAKYNAYLASPKWNKMRLKILKRDKYRCQYRVWIFFKCKNTRKLQVHHKTYARVFKEKPKDLITLCSKCHKLEHERLDKIKRKNK